MDRTAWSLVAEGPDPVQSAGSFLCRMSALFVDCRHQWHGVDTDRQRYGKEGGAGGGGVALMLWVESGGL